ncbi:hypothetical protein EVAR_80467_1 [Eumeta japonica]|uniref:SWIM-type domain-containing protein n=1 Tax=Eumeta variegata TaxID=151549 RepID=A0A4C1YP47_EUMVA|nr:hypothetical protein EVAR_80467_1 [Eumeta japonica]
MDFFRINGARVVIGVKCGCVYNQSGKCKHVSALISYVNNTTSLSKTSNEQQWGKPSIRQFVQNKYSKGRYFEDMFLPVAKKKCSLVRPVTYCELAQESSLKQVLDAGEQSKRVTDVKEVSTSLRSRHIVDLALSESDQSLRSPVLRESLRQRSQVVRRRSHLSSSTSSPQFKRPKTVNVPDFNQPKNQVQADFEWRVSTDVEECVGHREIADGAKINLGSQRNSLRH